MRKIIPVLMFVIFSSFVYALPDAGNIIALYDFEPNRVNVSGLKVIENISGNNGTITDYNFNQGSYNGGGLALNSSCGRYGNGVCLDGTSDFITIGETTAFSTVCNNGCTFCSWFKTNNISNEQIIIGKRDTTSNARFFRLYLTGSKGRLDIYSNGLSSPISAMVATTTIDTNWNHLCGVFNGTNLTLGYSQTYYNGIAEGILGSAINISTVNWTGSEQTFIGRQDDSSPSSYFNGSIDGTVIYSRPLSAGEISGLYENSNRYVNVSDMLIFQMAMENGNSTDTYDENNLVAGYWDNNTAERFDGVSEYISIPAKEYDLSSGTTFSFWAKRNDLERNIIFGNSSGVAYSWIYMHENGNFYLETDTNADICSANTKDDYEWHHYAISVENYRCQLYEDGINITSDETVTNNITFDWIGRYGTGANFNGSIDEVLIYNKSLNASAILELYESYGFPVLSNYTPSNLTPSYAEGENVTFEINTTDIDTDGVHWYEWVLDGARQAISSAVQGVVNVWTWVIGYIDADVNNPHNVTVYINDSDGNTISQTWIITVTNTSVLQAFEQKPEYISFDKQTISMYCLVNESANVDMYYSLPNSEAWLNASTPVYNSTISAYVSTVVTQKNFSWIGFIDFKCKANHTDSGIVAYQYDYDSVEVYSTQVAPNTPFSLTPTRGIYDANVPVRCLAIDQNGDTVYYDIQANYTNATNEQEIWKNISLNSTNPLFNWFTLNLPKQDNIKFRCRARDFNYNYSAWYSPASNISIRHGINLEMFSVNNKQSYYENMGLIFNLYCNVKNTNNSEIYKTWVDCNDDGQWDYVFDALNKSVKQGNKTGRIVSTSDFFTCKYSEKDNYTINVGCVTRRFNTSRSWDHDICDKMKGSDSYCNIAKEYEVEVIESEYTS